MNPGLVLASDLGSGSCKTIVIDASGRTLVEARQDYPTFYPHPGWVEQDPAAWYEAFCATVRAVIGHPAVTGRQIDGVGVFGVTHNAVLLSSAGRVLRRSILMFDDRSIDQVAAIKSRWGETVVERTQNSVSTTWTWPQLAWVRDTQPDVWRAVARIAFQKDYVRDQLAPAFVTDAIDAAGTLLFDPVESRWVAQFVADLGLSDDCLPRVVPPTTVVSMVSAAGAADTGLREGTPVIAGSTDTVAEMVGSGAVRTGAAIIKLASVGRIAVVSPAPIRHPSVLNYRHLVDTLWYPGSATKYAASAYRWFRETFWPDCPGDGAIYREMDGLAQEAPAGSAGLLFHPHLNGQWAPHWDERLRGAFIGITARHQRAHFTRAVLEGVAFAAREALDELISIGLTVDDIRLVGGGAKSGLWAQIMADVLRRQLLIPVSTDAAYGAALITASAFGLIGGQGDDYERIVASRGMRIVEPRPAFVERYEILYRVYRDSVMPLRKIGSQLQSFEHAFEDQPT